MSVIAISQVLKAYAFPELESRISETSSFEQSSYKPSQVFYSIFALPVGGTAPPAPAASSGAWEGGGSA